MKKIAVVGILIFAFTISCKKQKEDNSIIIEEIAVIETPISIDSIVVKNYHPRTFEFYKANNFNSIWYNKTNRDDYFTFLQNVDEDGLNPKEYWYPLIQKKINSYDSLNPSEISDLDALLTKSFFKLANNINSGKLNPRTLYPDWEITPEVINPEQLLLNALYAQKIPFVLDSLRPKNKIYTKLREALKTYKQLDSDSSYIASLQIKSIKKLVLNDTNEVVIDIKRKLDYLDLYDITDSISNVYTSDLELAVKKFQELHNLTPDGVIGNSTIKALNKNKNYRKNQIIANLERLRWFPKQLGENYVMVNIPEFKLWLISNNDTLLTKKIIVGREERKTPILSSKFSDIVFNPTWTVPPTILKKDLTPAAVKDTNYFHKNRIKIYKSGSEISPTQWQSSNASSYRYVQDPGKNNSLGIIKFNFPNKYSVYLHDTNHRSAFGRDGRDLSSGCVRVNDPLQLAKSLFELDNNTNMTSKKINELIENGKTTSIRIKNPIYVHQFYWTVSVDEDGEIKYNDDIYNLDVPLYKALQI
jgi:L,D-transpeptidase YcbB